MSEFDKMSWLDMVAEIERLRLNVFGLTTSDEAKSDIIRELHAEIERLRTALGEIAEVDGGGLAGECARVALERKP